MYESTACFHLDAVWHSTRAGTACTAVDTPRTHIRDVPVSVSARNLLLLVRVGPLTICSSREHLLGMLGTFFWKSRYRYVSIRYALKLLHACGMFLTPNACVPCTQPADYKRSIGYDFSEWGNFTEVVGSVPRVRWLRVDMASATPRSAAPHQILDSYNAWVAWRDNARKVRLLHCFLWKFAG